MEGESDPTERLLKTGDRFRSPDGKSGGESGLSSIPMAELTGTPVGRPRAAVRGLSALGDAKAEESEDGDFHDEVPIFTMPLPAELMNDVDRSSAEDAVNKYHRLINFQNARSKSKRITELKQQRILSDAIDGEAAAVAVLVGQAGEVAKAEVLNNYFKAANKQSRARLKKLEDVYSRAQAREADLIEKNKRLKQLNVALQRQYDEVSHAHRACVKPADHVVVDVAGVAPKTTAVKQRNRCATYAVVTVAVTNVAWLIAFLYAKNVIKF
jgi:hypothetical protein